MAQQFAQLEISQFVRNRNHLQAVDARALTGVIASSVELVDEINEERSVSFKLVKTKGNRKAFDQVKLRNYITIPTNRQTYRIQEIEKVPRSDRFTLDVQAEHVFYDIADFKLDAADVINGSSPFEPMIQYALAGTGWGYVLHGFWNAVTYENFGGSNQLGLFLNLINRHDIEFVPDSETMLVHLYPRIGGPSNSFIRVKHNLAGIRVNLSTHNLSTIQKGYGKKKDFPEGEEPAVLTDDDYILVETYRSPLADFWGELWADDFEDERYTVRDEIIAAMKKGMQDDVELSFDVEYVTIERNGKITQEYLLGDDIRVIHEGIDEDVTARIVKHVTYPFAKAKRPTLTIGNVRNSSTRIAESTEMLARSAGQSAAKAERGASAARQTAAKANETAQQADDLARRADEIARQAGESAARADESALLAVNDAREAVARAEDAIRLAQGSEGSSEEALRQANLALNSAESAQSAASSAGSAAIAAQGTANNASAAASNALNVANTVTAEVNSARKGESTLGQKIDKMDTLIAGKEDHTEEAVPIGNVPDIFAIKTPGTYYITNPESSNLPDHPVPGAAGWFLLVSKLAPGSGNFIQTLIRDGGTPDTITRRVGRTSAARWHRVGLTAL